MREEAIPLKILKLVFWILERFFISNQKQDDDYRSSSYSSSHSSDENNSDGGPSQRATSSLQKALALFDIESLDDKEITTATVRKKYRQLSRTYHPDKNNNSRESVEKMQEINSQYEIILLKIDRRDGVLPAYDEDNDNSDTETQGPSRPSENDEPISKEEKKRRRKARRKNRKKAQQEAENEWKALQRRQQKAYEEALRQERQEVERKSREYKQRRKKLKKEKHKIQKKYRTAGLGSPNGRNEAHKKWVTETMCHRKGREIGAEPTQNNRPKNLVMEYSTSEVATALRMGEVEIAIELVHEKIRDVAGLWLKEKFLRQERYGGSITVDSINIDNNLRERVLVNALLVPLDEDMNNILHYAVYFCNEELLSYLVEEARKWERLEEFVVSKNIYGLGVKDYAILVEDKVIENLITRLMQEVEKEVENRKFVPTFWKLVAKYDKIPTVAPFVLLGYGVLMGLIIFDAGWLVSLGVIISTLAQSESPMHQNIWRDRSWLPLNLVSYHGIWLGAKMVWGITTVVPWVSDYYLLSIPLVVISFVLMGNYFFVPIFKINRIVHGSITFLVDTIPLHRRLPPLLRTTSWLGIYFGFLLLTKAVVTKIRIRQYFYLLEPASTDSYPIQLIQMQQDPMQRAINRFNAVIQQEENDEL